MTNTTVARSTAEVGASPCSSQIVTSKLSEIHEAWGAPYKRGEVAGGVRCGAPETFWTTAASSFKRTSLTSSNLANQG